MGGVPKLTETNEPLKGSKNAINNYSGVCMNWEMVIGLARSDIDTASHLEAATVVFQRY